MNALTSTKDRSSHETARTRRKGRLFLVVIAVGAAAAAWSVVEFGFGFDLRGPAFQPDSAPPDIGAAAVVAATLTATIAGWGLLALLERWTSRARTLWTLAAVVAAVLSLGGPLSGSGVSMSNRLVLVGFHLLVAVLFVPLMRRTTTDSEDSR